MQMVAVEPMIQAKVVPLHVAAVAVRLHMAPSYFLNVMAAQGLLIIQMVVMVHILLWWTQTQLIVAAARDQLVLNTIAMVVGIGKAFHVELRQVLLKQDIPLTQV
jgi:hypothetical protein